MLRDEQKREEAKMKDKSLTERLEYFLTYNSFAVIAVIIAVIMIGWIAYAVMHFDKDALQVVITDQQGDTLSTDALTQACGVSGSVSYNTDLELANLDLSNTTVTDIQKIIALYQSNSVDVMIAPESVIEYYGAQGMFLSLEEVLTEDALAGLEEAGLICTVTLDETTDSAGSQVAAAIRISDTAIVEGCGMCIDDVCIGIPRTAAHTEEAQEFVAAFIN